MRNREHLRPVRPDQAVILIVEDEAMIQNFVRVMLEREGYFVLTAEDGEAALSLSKQYPGQIHLLLTDIMMPKMGGVELSRRISAERPGIQIVLMTGYTFAENIDPKFPCLQKPFKLKKLRDTIKDLIPACDDSSRA